MKKQLYFIFAFLGFLVLGTSAWFWINGLTPVLSSGETLPEDLLWQQYALTGASWIPEKQGYQLSLPGEVTEDLVLTIADMDEAELFLWGKPVAAWTTDGLYQRVRTIRLHAPLIQKMGGVQLLFRSSSWGSGTKDILSRKSMTQAKLLLSGVETAEKRFTLAFGVSMLSAGIHLLIVISSMALYGRKPSEKYLLFLSCVAAVSLFATVMTVNQPLLRLRFPLYRILQAMVATGSAVLHATVGPSLFEAWASPRIRRFLTVRTLVIILAATVTLRLVIGSSIYPLLRWLLLFPVVWVISGSCVQSVPGARILLMGYGLGESTVIFIFLLNSGQLAVPGAVVTYIQVNQLSYLLTLLPALIIINRRFADKFQESERLSGELSAMNAELDRLVEERTDQLWEEQAKKNNMMTNIFHDIRSPIFILQGNLDQLRLLPEDESIRTMMKSKLSFLTRLTEDLFLISKLEEEMVLYEENPMDLSELLELLAQANRNEAQEEGITLAFCCEGRLPVWADRQRLQQAFQNLLDNAFRYTPKGGSVSLEAFRKDNAVVVQVTDTGSGIAEKDIPLLFERYFKGSRADNPHSSGLGLYIAKEIVEHHQGTITVDSVIGEGSCFTVRLPFLEISN